MNCWVCTSPVRQALHKRQTLRTLQAKKKMVVRSVITPDPRKTVSKDAVLQVLAKRLLDIGRRCVWPPWLSKWPALESASHVSK